MTATLSLDTLDIHSTDLLETQGYPWEAWDLLRRDAPVFRYERPDIDPFWAVTRYDDVHFVGARNDLFSNAGEYLRLSARKEEMEGRDRRRRRIEARGWDPNEVQDMVFMDRPRHTMFRNLAARSFTPKAMKQLEAHLAQYAARFVAEFVDKLEREGSADLVEDFAVKLPLATICDIMGLPVDDWEPIHRWTGTFFLKDAEIMHLAKAGETIDELRMRLSLEFADYLEGIASRARANNDGSLTARVVNGEVDGQPLTAQQLYGYLMLLIGAGNETTRNATSGGVIALLQRPDQIDKLCTNPDLVETAAEEILRWTSPVIQFARTATHDVELQGQKIRKGDTVGVFYPSANRDERQFDDPYVFDVTRSPNYHQAFGHGAHFCLGANLARWELRAALRALVPVLPRLALDGDVTRIGHLHVGAIKHQQITLR